MAHIIEQATGDVPAVEVDVVTLDIIENALRNARYEMDEVLFRTALSPGIREQHDEFPLIGDPEVIDDGGRVRWVSGRPGEPPVDAGTDFIILRDGRIAAVYLFFDNLP